MARKIIPINRFQGISDSEKEGAQSSFLFSRSCDYRTDPSKLLILPRSNKDSGTVVTDLILDGSRVGENHYFIGDTGNIYKRTNAGLWTKERELADSHGNGMAYFGEDDYLYYNSDTTIGRYGPTKGTPTWVDDFMGAQGGVPLNTASLDLELSSSQYATAADSASLSITGDITLECYRKIESLPAVGNTMTLMSKWNQASNQRSYTFDLYSVSGYFGNGGDGALTISSDTTNAPIDSACTGTAATYTLSATNASFAIGQKILIHQTQGTGAGKWERNEITGYTAGTITLSNVLVNSYTTGAQVLVLKEYTDVTVNSGKTWTAKAWNGTVGGILSFLASGTVNIIGTITASNKGFRGGAGRIIQNGFGYCGEGTAGVSAININTSPNGNGGGSAFCGDNSNFASGGGGGGNGGAGSNGLNYGGSPGEGGSVAGTADLTTLVFGGGGSGGVDANSGAGSGANGGGIIFITGVTTTISGSIVSLGGAASGASGDTGGGGGGGGGSILLKSQVATLGTSLITATGGNGDTGPTTADGGNGGTGRIHLDYYTSYTGTTGPTLDSIQDSNLVTTTSYQLRLGISNDGTAEEFLTKTLSPSPSLATWYRYAVSWDASASQAEFYVNGTSIGISTGVKTAIYNSTALFAVGARFNAAGNAENFFDGKCDDDRVWNDVRTSSEIYNNKDVEISGASSNLAAYWQFDSTLADATGNTNTLTLVNAPSYDIADVPFASPTTRQDLDQSLNTSGQAYPLTTAINEAVTHRQSFVPAKDPQKSIEVNISDTGDDGNWTLTLHDAQNRLITSKTILYAQLHTGDFEFTFDSVWRPVIGQTYHFHLTTSSTTGAPAVVTTTTEDLETADFHTYYQFLVDDDNHPIETFLNFMVIGNERYLAKWDGITYNPHVLTLPSGYHIRCLGQWREYLVVGVVIGNSFTDYEYGMLFFWDGTSDTYNFYRYVPQGPINAILSGDPLYFMAGYAGDLMIFDGGNPRKLRRMPFVKNSDTLSINRKALTMWRALVHIGFSSVSTSTGIYRGVYSYGTLNERLSPTLSFDYPLSLGITQSANLEIGMLFATGTNLFASWKNGTTYGVDVVKPSNAPYATARYESLITDADKIYQEKNAMTLRGSFKALTSGDSVRLEYKIDRESDWTEGIAEATAGKKEVRLPFPTKDTRFDEIQVAVNLTTINATSPEFYGIGIEYDDLSHERRV